MKSRSNLADPDVDSTRATPPPAGEVGNPTDSTNYTDPTEAGAGTPEPPALMSSPTGEQTTTTITTPPVPTTTPATDARNPGDSATPAAAAEDPAAARHTVTTPPPTITPVPDAPTTTPRVTNGPSALEPGPGGATAAAAQEQVHLEQEKVLVEQAGKFVYMDAAETQAEQGGALSTAGARPGSGEGPADRRADTARGGKSIANATGPTRPKSASAGRATARPSQPQRPQSARPARHRPARATHSSSFFFAREGNRIKLITDAKEAYKHAAKKVSGPSYDWRFDSEESRNAFEGFVAQKEARFQAFLQAQRKTQDDLDAPRKQGAKMEEEEHKAWITRKRKQAAEEEKRVTPATMLKLRLAEIEADDAAAREKKENAYYDWLDKKEDEKRAELTSSKQAQPASSNMVDGDADDELRNERAVKAWMWKKRLQADHEKARMQLVAKQHQRGATQRAQGSTGARRTKKAPRRPQSAGSALSLRAKARSAHRPLVKSITFEDLEELSPAKTCSPSSKQWQNTLYNMSPFRSSRGHDHFVDWAEKKRRESRGEAEHKKVKATAYSQGGALQRLGERILYRLHLITGTQALTDMLMQARRIFGIKRRANDNREMSRKAFLLGIRKTQGLAEAQYRNTEKPLSVFAAAELGNLYTSLVTSRSKQKEVFYVDFEFFLIGTRATHIIASQSAGVAPTYAGRSPRRSLVVDDEEHNPAMSSRKDHHHEASMAFLASSLLQKIGVGGKRAMGQVLVNAKVNFFELYDANQDGVLSKDEFLAGLDEFAMDLPELQRLELFNGIDRDNSDTISFLEFEELLILCSDGEARRKTTPVRDKFDLAIGEAIRLPQGKPVVDLNVTWKNLEDDVDAALVLFGTDDHGEEAPWRVCYYDRRAPDGPDGALACLEDAGSGAGAKGETIRLRLHKVPAHVTRGLLYVTCHDATFEYFSGVGCSIMVQGKSESGKKLVQVGNLLCDQLGTSYLRSKRGMVLCELHRVGGVWEVKYWPATASGLAGVPDGEIHAPSPIVSLSSSPRASVSISREDLASFLEPSGATKPTVPVVDANGDIV